jgi:conjugal transfer pilin signal peptidase TrbI
MSHAGSPVPPMRGADIFVRSATARRLALLSGLGAGALGLNALSGFATSHALMINASPSLPYWAIWTSRTGSPQRGDIIVFTPPASPLLKRHFGTRPQPFGKIVSGMPGDLVTREGRTFHINGRPVATAKTMSRLGEPLALGPNGKVPENCYFVTTPHKDGFDSRYAAIGWVCRERILGTGRPIL